LENVNSEFQNGGFVPKEYEVKINSEYVISPTSKIHFVGYADRVDSLKNGNDEYIRIIDYKTNKKIFSLDLVKEGFDMQMPLYLFSYCKNNEIPAGIMYFNCGFPNHNGKPFSRNGIVLDSPLISDATEFLKKNSLLAKTSFKKGQVFKELEKTVTENIRKIGKTILDGHMEINPTVVAKKDPCKYCNARLYCRQLLKSNDDD
jgi:ATP-dependent helicase/nuclease subunit B